MTVLEKTDAEGHYIIDDGIITHSALKELYADYLLNAVFEPDDKEAAIDSKLLDIFTNGYKVKVVKYPQDDSRDARVVYQAGKHNVDNNRYKITSVSIIIETGEYALRLNDKIKTKAMSYLTAQYGKSSKSTSWTWITASEQLAPEVRASLKSLDKVKPSLIILNHYFVGNTTNAKERLSTKFQLYALDPKGIEPTLNRQHRP